MANKTYKFCPFCSKKLTKNKQGYQSCSCGYINYENARPTASTLIINDKNELLLGKRTIEPFKDMPCIIGGFLNKDEKPEVGAIREAKEETGLDVEITGLIGIYIGWYEDPKQGSYHTFNVVYPAKIVGGELKGTDDVYNLQFFSLDKLPTVAFKNNQDAIRDLLKEMNK